VFFKLAYSSEFGGSNSKKDLLFLRAQTHATQRSNKPFYLLFVVFAEKSGWKNEFGAAFLFVFGLVAICFLPSCRFLVFVDWHSLCPLRVWAYFLLF
jgi:hypothetical protein